MNRILKRPMFRMGGSTEGGITSGLRQGYDNGGNIEKAFQKHRAIYDKYSPPRGGGFMPGSVSSFLTNFGLNLLSQSPTGNVFQTAGRAAQQPFQSFQAARAGELDEQRRLNQAILGDVIEAETEKDIARIESSGTGNIGATAKTNAQIAALYEQSRTLTREAKQLQDAKDKGEEIDEDRLVEITDPDFGLLASIKEQIRVSTGRATITEKIKNVLGSDWLAMRINEYEGAQHPDADPPRKYTRAEAEAKALEDAKDLLDRLGNAEGGRIGKAMGGDVSFEEEIEVEEPIPTRTAASSVQNLDYATLRARLPQEINDSIVKLLSESEEALTQFANIRTQEDVDQFNSQFSVNLVLPAEV